MGRSYHSHAGFRSAPIFAHSLDEVSAQNLPKSTLIDSSVNYAESRLV